MEIKRFEFNFFGENTYVIWDASSQEAAIVDPGMVNPEETDQIEDFIATHRLSVRYILLTHAHVDHTFGIDILKEKYHAPVLAHKADLPLGQMRGQQAEMFHLPMKLGPVEIDRFISANTTLNLGNERIEVIETPGHSPGGVCYYVPESSFILTGDTLFQGSIGRTDLPGGDHNTLLRSISTGLFNLPDNTVVYPGHGPATTIGKEKRTNPFFN
jgi:metallo-beta-lactamase family protein